VKHGVPSAADGGFGSAAYERQKSNGQRDQFARLDGVGMDLRGVYDLEGFRASGYVN
jgi:hypothetical protein